MKNIMLALSFSTFSAHAGPRTDYFDYNEKNRNVRCPVQVCAMDDYGRSYTQICRDLREMPSARGRLQVTGREPFGLKLPSGQFLADLTMTLKPQFEQNHLFPTQSLFRNGQASLFGLGVVSI